MRMLRFFPLTLSLALLVAGCASGREAYIKTLEAWQGRHIDQLTAVWGPAQATRQSRDGAVMYRWDNRRLASRPMPPPPYDYDYGWGWRPWGWRFRHAYGYRRHYVRWCETVIVTDARGLITGWHFRGNGCADYAEESSADGPPAVGGAKP